MPDDINTRDVCVESGKLPSPLCKHTIEDYYSITHTLSQFCDVEKEYLISPDKKIQYCASCLRNHNYRSVIYKDYPKELLNYWKKIGRSYSLAPPHNPSCERLFAGEGPKIISPTNGMAYLVTSDDQKITFQASSSVDVREQYWYLNNTYLGRFKAGEKIFKGLANGQYTASCLDDKGRISTIKFLVNHL
jgi:penicillin-binding protein 1C